MTINYPTNLDGLVSMIEREWPLVKHASRAYQWIVPGNLKTSDETRTAESLKLSFGVVRCCGLETEGQACEHPLFFTHKKEAIRELWSQYLKLTPPRDYETDTKGVLFVWRDKPEYIIHPEDKTYSARMRYGCVYEDRHGTRFSRWV